MLHLNEYRQTIYSWPASLPQEGLGQQDLQQSLMGKYHDLLTVVHHSCFIVPHSEVFLDGGDPPLS